MAEEGYKVTLHVYDLSQGLARQFSTTLLGKTIEGIWHTGLVVYGYEYFFGGGIQCTPAGKTVYGKPVKVAELGVTHVPKELFEEYLREISPRYTMETYNLFKHNCNNFSNEVAQFLVGSTIPDYILQLPNEVLNSPLSPLILPMFQQLETTLKVGAVPQAPQLKPMASAGRPSEIKFSATEKPQTSAPAVPKDQNTVHRKDAGETSEARDINSIPPPAVKPASEKLTSGDTAVDPLGSARNIVQDEITREFRALMASGTLRASEAAAIATRKVMERYGVTNMARG